MRFGVLGPLVVRTPDGRPVHVPEVKVRALLTVLLIHAGRPVSADRLIDDLWNGRPPAGAAAALRVKVSQLRRALGERELVAYRAPGYVLRADADSVDAGHFESLLGRAQRTDDLEVRASLLRQALGLWRGGAYAEFADEPFARAAVARLDEQRLVAEEELAETRLALGEHGLLAADLTDLVAAHPLRERLRAAHVRALYLAGRQGEALASHRELRRLLAEELGLDPGPELAALHQAIVSRDPSLTPPPARPRTNLPAPLTRLVGRDEAVTEVRALIGTNRLVTLTGPGGVGKTRLALAAADPAADPADDPADGGFDGGVWLVELASLGAGAGVVEVAEAIADVLGVRDDAPGGILERLPGTLRAGRTLLVLDNCEHLVEQVATLADRLLRAAPGLCVLATSQESLRIEGEVLWSVPPLDRAAAIELFTTRAGLKTTTPTPTSTRAGAGPGPGTSAVAESHTGIGAGTDTPDSAGVDANVAEICARLDGIPLALELAATRMRVLTPRQLAERLDDRFQLLASGLRGAPARQQTLRAMIDWSWELLSDDERVVLRRLSVHADGCTLEAAEEVCAEPGLDVLGLLARLVDRSLVTRTPAHETGRGPAAEPRYRLLESVAAYCQERLEEAGELTAVRHRHLRHYTALAVRLEPRLRGPEQCDALVRLDAETANLRTALETAVREGVPGEALRLVNAMAWYWVLRGRLGEGRRALEAALSVARPGDGGAAKTEVWSGDPGAAEAEVWLAGFQLLAGRLAVLDREWFAGIEDARRRAGARWFAGFALLGYEDAADSETLLAAALVEFRELGDTWGTAAALTVLARHSALRGDLAGLREHAEQGLALFRRAGDRWGELRAAENLAMLAEITGDYDRATALRREILGMAEELELWSSVSDALSRLGRIAMLEGDHARADDYHERARLLAVAQSNPPAEEFAELGLALGARRQGRLDEAERRLRAWLGWVEDVSGDPGAALILAELGFVAEQRGDAAGALDLQRQGLAVARRVGDPRAIALALEGLAGAQTLAGRHQEAARLLNEAAALRESVGAPLPPGERGDVDRITARMKQALEPDRTPPPTR
ncbi:tetratricopeptide repeat protein [Nonomuraea fuscirosea]|uniref:BTAD domain-containing putative transcriptional regulator n=1 Tax=Nonomuraea fuscirosea TaxID=1291556 RepID=UPI002DDC2E49|nr:BTAD domain-containing putative transcriptional regulator [Nonomuraea fuscirosea]WSA53184.1 tetratricopeptide repeat protein [Nonomuraea fuscirosea]